MVFFQAALAWAQPTEITVWATSVESPAVAPENVLDGRLDTRWASEFADDQYLEIDFGQPRAFDRVEIVWERAFAREYAVLASSDGEIWAEVYATTNGAEGLASISVATQTARWARIHAVRRGTPWGNSIREVRFFLQGQNLLPPGTPVRGRRGGPRALAVDVNQAFYAPSARKIAVVRCDEPREGGRFKVIGAGEEPVAEGDLVYWGSRWDRHFWTADFSAVREEGSYTVRVTFADGRAAEAAFEVGVEPIRAAALKTLEYFAVQRCGAEVPGWHPPCHLDDARKPDGTHRDATGGWHDCAGFDKEVYTTFLPVYFYATLAAEAEDEATRHRLLEEARWGADWLAKMTDTNGYLWCHVEPHNLAPEAFVAAWSKGTDTDNIVGTPDDRTLVTNAWGPEEGAQALSMGALAKLAWVLRDSDPAASARYRQTAESIRGYLSGREYFYADEIALGRDYSHYADYHAGFLLADVYQAQLETNGFFLEDARRRISFLIDRCQTKEGEFVNSFIERVPMSGRALDAYVHLLCFEDFCACYPDDPAVARIKDSVRLFMEGHARASVGASPYGQAQLLDPDLYHYIAVNTHWRDFEKPAGSVSQGKNCYWLALATACAVADRLLGTDYFREIGTRQIDWVLGQNPFGCSTVAAVGYRFPRMFTMYYWLENHPGSDGVIPGGVINGIGGDPEGQPRLDLRKTNWLNWETNEYWNPPTAWFALACWRYYQWARAH